MNHEPFLSMQSNKLVGPFLFFFGTGSSSSPVTVLEEGLGDSMVLVLEEQGGCMLLTLVEEPGVSTVLDEDPGGSMLLVLVEEVGESVVLVLPKGKGVEERLGMMSTGSSASSAIDVLALFAESSRCIY